MGLSPADRSLLSSVVLYVPLGLLLFVGFLLLRLSLPRFYAARRSHGYPSPPARGGLFGWIRPTLAYTEREMLSTHGLDTVMILRVARSCFYMLLLMFFIGWAVIAPVNASGSNRDQNKYVYPSNCTCIDDCKNCRVRNPFYAQGLSVISMANINPTGGSESYLLFAHLFSIYLISIFGLFLLYADWRAYADLRVRHLSQRRIAASTVLVRGLGLPEGAPLDEAENAITAYFARLFPNEVTRVIVAAAGQPIRRLMKEWNKAVTKAEREEGSERWGEKKQHLRARITEMQAHLRAGKFALVTFRSRVTASLVAWATLTSSPDVLHPRYAPGPNDVNWKAAEASATEQRIRAVVVFVFATLLILFWSIPVTLAASLANLEYLAQRLHFLRPVVNWSATLTGIVSGILPALVVLLLSRLLQWVIHVLSRVRRLHSHSDMDNTERNIFFSFQFINIVLIFTVSAALFRNLKSFLDALSFSRVVDLLAVSLPPQVNFFSTYVLTAAVLDQMLDLVRPGDLALLYIKRWLAKTPREKEEAEKPPTFDYPKQYAYLSLFIIICLVFWLLSPVITVWGVMYFGLHYLVMKHNLLYTMRQPYEAGGRLWPAAFTQIAFGLVFFQTVMFGVFLTYRFFAAPAVLPLIVITSIVAVYMRRQWGHVSEQGALERLAYRGAKDDEDEEGGEVDPVVLHEGDYAQPERLRLQDDVVELGAH